MYNVLLVGALKRCEDESGVEAVFKKFHKKDDDYGTKIKYLDICRGNPQTFFAGDMGKEDSENLRSKYLTVRSMFLTGSWR